MSRRRHPVVTWHAIERAMERWLEPSEESARRAIWYVVEHGHPIVNHRCLEYRCGRRGVRIARGRAVTVVVH